MGLETVDMSFYTLTPLNSKMHRDCMSLISVIMDSCQNNIDDVAFGLSHIATRKIVIDSCANRQVIIINILMWMVSVFLTKRFPSNLSNIEWEKNQFV